MSLPGMSGGRTTDIATIQKNILAIQGMLNKKIYSPGDIRPSQVIVVASIYHFICIINIRIRELKGYMAFINSRKDEFEVMDIFNMLCPPGENETTEMQERFLQMFYRIKNNQRDYLLHHIYFVRNYKSLEAEMVY